MSAPVIPTTVQDTINRAVLLGALMKAIGAERDQLRASLASSLPAGTKLTGRDPRNDDTLGTVSLSDPAKVAVVTDQVAFEEYVRRELPGDLDTVRGFGEPGEVAAVLAEHAPHLLTTRTVVPEHVTERVLLAATLHPVPGTTVITPSPTLTVTPRSAAHRVVREVLAGSPVPAVELEAKA